MSVPAGSVRKLAVDYTVDATDVKKTKLICIDEAHADSDDKVDDSVTESSLSVRTQHESLSLRTSFRSQLQLGIVPKSVQFDNLSIREYPIVIGDSPSTSRGVPISIGWEYGPECTVDLDAYEATRVLGGVCERRTKSELR